MNAALNEQRAFLAARIADAPTEPTIESTSARNVLRHVDDILAGKRTHRMALLAVDHALAVFQGKRD